jgi:phosphopentomutase
MQHNMPNVFGEGERLDVMTFYMAKAYMENNHPKVVYMDFGDTDDWAHMGKYAMYLDAAHKSDAMLQELWSYLQSDPFYKDQTTLLVVCDHGRGYVDKWTSHGSSIPHADETYLLMMGPDTPAKGEMNNQTQIYQDQYAQTIAELLGFHFTANHPVGEPIQGTK